MHNNTISEYNAKKKQNNSLDAEGIQIGPALKNRLIKLGKWTPKAFMQNEVTFDGFKVIIPTQNGGSKIYDLTKEKDSKNYILTQGESSILGDTSPDEIILVEGEWDYFSCLEHGIQNVITATAGALTFKQEWIKVLVGKKIYIVYDNDNAGKEGARKVARMLADFDCEVYIVNLPEEVGHGGDIRDFFAKLSKDKEDFYRLLAETTQFNPPRSCFRASQNYPILREEALYGIAGKIVRKLAEHSEASEPNLLGHFLGIFSNVVGRTSYTWLANNKYYANTFQVIVGDTSKARKGTAYRMVLNHIFLEIDPTWKADNRLEGLGSGEGLIQAVRDPSIDSKGINDPGVTDKRLLLVEEEFAALLSKMNQKNSILSPTLRTLWDSGNFSQKTKYNPIQTTNAHISLIGHITEYELEEAFKDVEAANGFGNRFLWFAVMRGKKELITRTLEAYSFTDEISRLKESINFSRKDQCIQLSTKAKFLFNDFYQTISECPKGYLGRLCSRSEAHLLKIALIYALLDCSTEIDEINLRAAMALVQFSIDSCNFLFQRKRFSSEQLKILTALEASPDPISRGNLLKHVFASNLLAAKLDEILLDLEHLGLIYSKKEGRVTYWFLRYEGEPCV
jgi:hypothetical protein